MEFKEQIQRILENVPKVYDAGRGFANNEFSNALKGNKSGEAVAMPDVSPIKHDLGARVSSKNLLDITQILGRTVANEADGASLSCGLDGGITGSGTPTTSISFYGLKTIYLEHGQYTLSSSGIFDNISCVLYFRDANNNALGNVGVATTNRTFILNTANYGNFDHVTIEIKRANNNVEMSGTAYFQLEKGTKATPYTPFVPDISAVKLLAFGKNICNTPTLKNNERISWYIGGVPWIKNAKYTLSADVTVFEDDTAENTYFDFHAVYTDGTNTNGRIFVAHPGDAASFRDGKPRHYSSTIVCDSTKQLRALLLSPLACSSDVVRSCKAENIQLEIGTETAYEPYVEPTEYAVNEDGTVSGLKSIFPCTTLMTDTEGVLIECEYNRDINKALAELQQAIILLGGQV